MERALVVLPTLNERVNIDVVLHAIPAEAPAVDVLVVDDDSVDGTADHAEALADEIGRVSVLRRIGRPGFGEAYRAGFAFGLDHGFELENTQAEGYGFQIEMVHRAVHAGASIVEIPISFPYRRAARRRCPPESPSRQWCS